MRFPLRLVWASTLRRVRAIEQLQICLEIRFDQGDWTEMILLDGYSAWALSRFSNPDGHEDCFTVHQPAEIRLSFRKR